MKTYKIITLGASGAGKTVFLSSLFKELSTQGIHGFYLDVADSNQRKVLNTIYTQLATEDEWPPGTRYSEVSEWTFTCYVRTHDLMDFPACRFTYFDYAGGRLTDAEGDPEFTDIVKQADSLLGILDGQKIHALLTGINEFAANTLLKHDLPSILQQMQNCRVPIQFLVSKWDVLESDFSLSQVRNRLLQIPEFEAVVRARNRLGSPVRLIPVSSVGPKFARPQLDGSMRKISGATPQPFQTEVPLACVFPDGLKARIGELREQQKQLKQANEGKRNPFLSVIEIAIPIAKVAYGLSLDYLPPQYRFARPFLEKLGEAIDEAVQKGQKDATERAKRLFREQETSLKQVKDEETALKHAIDCFLYMQIKLGKSFPGSDLSLI